MHRVLVVEDEEPVARALERWLKRQKVEVYVLLESTRAEATLISFQPTHVVCDLRMPGLDGLQVLALARTLVPHAVRSLLSGSLESLNQERLTAVLPCNLVSKPWRESTLASDLGLAPQVVS